MIIANHTTFRAVAAVRTASPIAAATFADANPDTIADPAGDFVADGVLAGMVTRPNGTASNDGFLFTVATVAVNLLTLIATDAVVAEVAAACTLDSYWLDRDGFEEFPGAFGHVNKVRAGGFDTGFTGIPQPYQGSSFNVSVNALAADAVPHTDEYHWYLSQRSDDPAAQYLTIVPYTNVVGQTYSGSVSISATALAASEIGYTPGDETPTDIAEIFKMCDLYCIRISGQEIQWINLLKEMIGAS